MDEITVPSLSALRVKEVSPTQAQPKKRPHDFLLSRAADQ